MRELDVKSAETCTPTHRGNGEATFSDQSPETPPDSAPASSEPATPASPPPPKEPTAGEIYDQIFSILSGENPISKRPELRSHVSNLIKCVMKRYEVSEKYNWLIIHDSLSLTRGDADKIYTAINKFNKKQEVGVILTSGGGQIEPAYLISKLCRESSTGKFIVVVPRRAKSAATLVCCGADEIHMGQMSELGPIDPQFGDMPALGLKNAVHHLAELASEFPKASDMFAKYLAQSLNLENLGYYERVAESAVQYAERLLRKRIVPLKSDPKEVATQLVYNYMDHSFVIDRTEAESIFGSDMIKGSTQAKEYEMGNAVYEWLSVIGRTCENFGFSFYFYGSPESECGLFKKKK